MAVAPTLIVRYTTDDADDATPTWTDVTSYVRSFSTSRGRESELSRVDAGTATIVLDNRTRAWDPTLTSALRPMNRWNIRATLPNATTEDIFLGYAEAYEQQWPATGKDAITIVRCADEFKLLAQDAVLATDPPRDTYQDMVLFDEPRWYVPMDNDSTTFNVAAAVGEGLTAVNSLQSVSGNGAILGQVVAGYTGLTQNGYLRTQPINAGHELDPGGLTEFTIEGWFAIASGLPSAGEQLVRGPTAGSSTWSLELRTDGLLEVNARNSGGTVHTVTSTTAVTNDQTFFHVVATITGGSLRIYVDGTEEDSTAWSGAFAAVSTASVVTVGNGGTSISTKVRYFDEIAFYRQGLSAARVTAHYDAGTARGFARNETPDDRIVAAAAASSSVAPTSVGATSRTMTATYMHGQSPLEVMREAEFADGADAVLFIAKDGTITFLAVGHQSSAPYTTVQATFDDDGTDLPYQDITVDYSDSFIANEWNVTPKGGTTSSATDSTSISLYGKRPQSITDWPSTDGAAAALANTMMNRYKDPMFRITGLTLVTKTDALMNAVFPLELGDRIRVLRTQPGGGARIDQELFIQKINVDGEPGRPWLITLAVSPL